MVEDDLSFAQIIEEALALWGYHAEWVTTGGIALERMNAQPADLILLDIYLPDGPGYQLIRDFKRINSKVHIVAMTGYNSRELEREVRRQGVSYYMIKPFEIDQLKSILDHITMKTTQASQEREG